MVIPEKVRQLWRRLRIPFVVIAGVICWLLWRVFDRRVQQRQIELERTKASTETSVEVTRAQAKQELDNATGKQQQAERAVARAQAARQRAEHYEMELREDGYANAAEMVRRWNQHR